MGTVFQPFRSGVDAVGRLEAAASGPVPVVPLGSRVVRFGVFTVDLEAGELLKSGRRVKLQEQPFQLLTVLLEQSGRVVTREELRQRLWPADTFVDFDRSLNTATSKLREALGDSAENPRFVETLPRRGYRFVASAEALPTARKTAEASEPRPAKRLPVPNLRRGLLAIPAALLILAAGIWIGGRLLPLASSSAPGRVVRFSYSPELGMDPRPMLSPDGRHIAYVSVQHTLRIQDLDRAAPREIEGTEGVSHPFWSPSGNWIAFACRQEIQKVAVGGGAVQTVGKLPETGVFAGGSWSPDGGTMVFAMFQAGLYSIPATGGKPSQLLAHPHVETPHFLPSGSRGRALLFVTGEAALRPEHAINVYFLDTGKREVLTRVMANWATPVHSSTGHILYASSAGNGTHLWALPFSAEAGRATGEAFPITLEASLAPSVGGDGTLVYLDPGNPQRQLVWRDRRGHKIGAVVGTWPDVLMPALSRDGSRLAAVVVLNGYYDVCVLDPERAVTTRLTFNSVGETHPLWGPGGEQVTFASWVTGTYDIFTKPADGSGEPSGLVTGKEWDVPEDWSGDGRFLVYRRLRAEGFGDLWYLKARPEGGYEAAPLLMSPDTDEVGAKLSPDGRMLAYASNQTGRYEVYVREFPSGGGPWQVSTRGGTQPRWRRDGREVFYVEDHTLVAAAMATAPRFAVLARQALFQCQGCFGGRTHQYDVSADGQRFLVAESVGESRKPVIRVVQNWFDEFRQRR